MKQQQEEDPEAATINPAVLAANEAEAARLKQRAIEIMDFSQEKFPYTAATPDPYLLVRSGMMYDRLGKPDVAQNYFDFAEERAYGSLKYYFTQGGTFRKVREYVYPLQMLRQHYGQKVSSDNSYQDRLAGVSAKIQELSTINPKGMNLQ
jgi:hypothetical protein